MKKRNITLISLLATMVAVPSMAMQENTVRVTQTSDVNTLKQQDKDVIYFSQSGLSTDGAEVKNSAGKGLPLKLAITKIIPQDWAIKPTGNFEEAIVSWKGGISWPLIVRNIASNEAIFVHLDWVQKIASIHVPGNTNTEVEIAQNNGVMTDDDKQAFRKEQRQRWVLRDDDNVKARTKDENVANLIEQYSASQESNRQYIKELNETNESLERNLETIKERLAREKAKREAVEKRYAVLNPAGVTEEKDAIQLAEEYKQRNILPYNKSFDYFTNGGGHADIIDARTPATYIAKQGKVHEVLAAWANDLGWHFEKVTNVTHDNPYEGEFKGTFIEASIKLVSIFENSRRPIDVQFIPDVKYTDPDTGEVKHGVIRLIDYDYKKNYDRTQPMSR